MVGDGGRGRGSVFVKFLKSNSRVVCSGDRRGEKFEKECIYHFCLLTDHQRKSLSRLESKRLRLFSVFLVRRKERLICTEVIREFN